MCHNPTLVRDMLLGAPAYVKLAYPYSPLNVLSSKSTAYSYVDNQFIYKK